MYCKYCGANIDDDSAFCKECGGNLSSQSIDKQPITQETSATLIDGVCINCGRQLEPSQTSNLCDECYINLHSKKYNAVISSAWQNNNKTIARNILAFIVIICAIIGIIYFANQSKYNNSNNAIDSDGHTASSNVTVSSENEPTISLAEYNAIKTDMTYDEVCEIIGSYGTEMSRAEAGGYETVMIMWPGKGITGANANFTFQNGKLFAKAQIGLE